LFLFQFLKYFPGGTEIWGAIIIPGLVMTLIAAMPWIGRWKLGHRFNLGFLAAMFMGIGMLTWQALSDDQREKLTSRFRLFFELTQPEKDKALSTLSEPERRQIEKTLRSFEKLNPVTRAMCIHSFEKFANLSLAERQQFLKNAERWKLMTPDERQAWKELVERVPLMPPSIDLPPRPPQMPASRPNPRMVTNGN